MRKFTDSFSGVLSIDDTLRDAAAGLLRRSSGLTGTLSRVI
jgi:hypothetical protein